MNAYIFVFKGIPDAKNKSFSYELHQGAWILACVIDDNSDSAKRKVFNEITSRGWIPGPSRAPLVIQNPEKLPPEQLPPLEKTLLSLLQKCVDCPDKGIALEFYSTLREDNQLVDRLDV